MRGIGGLVAFVMALAAAADAQEDRSIISASGNEAFFVSPTGHIQCALTAGDEVVAECHFRRFTPSAAPSRLTCSQSWGFFLDHRSPGRIECADPSFVLMQTPKVLGFGRWVALAGLTCRSERYGVACTNESGHGFRLAPAMQSLF
jgi:hypothetical protein